MQIKCAHRKFYHLDPTRDELSLQAVECFDKLALFDQLRCEGASQATALKAAGYSRVTPCRRKRACGRKPGQMVQIDHAGIAIDGWLRDQGIQSCFPGLETVLHACLIVRQRRRPLQVPQSCAGELSAGALNVELARFDCLCNACRPHQALGQTAPCRRIIGTSNKARWPPEKSHMY